MHFTAILPFSLLCLAAVSAAPSGAPPTLQERSDLAARALNTIQQDALTAHNAVRATHNAKALTWSTTLEASAKAWAEKCVYKHGGANGAGQNLAVAASTAQAVQSGKQVTTLWADEEKLYNYSKPGFSSATGHFTQVVWRSTTQIGCWQADCGNRLVDGNGNRVFDARFTSNVYTVCNYSPPGNYEGQYEANVQKTPTLVRKPVSSLRLVRSPVSTKSA